MTFNEMKFKKLVKLMSGHRADSSVNKKIAMLSRVNVNKYVGNEPLIVHYLRECTKPNLNILTAFATKGCDFNAQGHGGQTSLHLLVSKKLDYKMFNYHVEAVKILLAHGGDLAIVDNNGNNVLMFAVLTGQDRKVEECLTKDIPLTKLLLTQNNRDGDDALSLLLLSAYKHGDSAHSLKRLVRLGADVTRIHTYGDSS